MKMASHFVLFKKRFFYARTIQWKQVVKEDKTARPANALTKLKGGIEKTCFSNNKVSDKLSKVFTVDDIEQPLFP
jgi:hypothetical protein